MSIKITFLVLNNKEIPVQIFLDEIPLDARKKVIRQFEQFEVSPTEFIRNPKFFKKIPGYEKYKLWEFRIQFNKIQYRVFAHLDSTTCHLIHAFIKKEQKTPQRHLELSKQRIQTYIYYI